MVRFSFRLNGQGKVCGKNGISSIKSVRNRNDSEKRCSRYNVKPEKINQKCMFS